MRKATNPRYAGDIKTAIIRENPVTITYRRDDGKIIVRTIEPYDIIKVESTGNHLIKSVERESGEYRSFRTDRVISYTVGRGRFHMVRPATKAAAALDDGWAQWAELTYDPDREYQS
jgi:predicted DNA-binding transcriptional regulator YafY